MGLLQMYFVIFLPVAAAVVMVFVNFYAKKKIKELREQREKEYIRKQAERVLAEHLRYCHKGDLIEEEHIFRENEEIGDG